MGKKSQKQISKEIPKEDIDSKAESVPFYVLITTYLSYLILIIFGHIRDFFGKIFKSGEYAYLRHQNGYAPLNSDFENFYQRRMYLRIRDAFNRPITNVPGRTLTLLDRVSHDKNKTFELTGTTTEVLNLSSYNYLGFAQNKGPCADAVKAAIKKDGITADSPRMVAGTHEIHRELEKLVARFVKQEDAMVVNMGFATNSTTIPALVQKGSLIISDQLNHSSLIFGARISGSKIRVFKHNDMKDLEGVLREAISQGQPRTHRPWKKILVMVEGLYSMEGNILKLDKLVELKKKYKFYLYVDEAHSIGALGKNGRGVCDYWNIDPNLVDIHMGTFTKSFGAAGGYIAGKKKIIDWIRLNSHSNVYAEGMSPLVCQQIITSFKIIMGEDGTSDGKKRIKQLMDNSRLLSTELKKMGFIVYGDKDSPVVPLLLYNPAKISAFSREALARKIGVVVVGYPATPILSSRVRFCCSASHSREDMEEILKRISEIGDLLQLKVSTRKNIEF